MRCTLTALLLAALLGLGACGGGSSKPERAKTARAHNPSPKQVRRQVRAFVRRQDPRIEGAVRFYLRKTLGARPRRGNKPSYRHITNVNVRHGHVTLVTDLRNARGAAAARLLCTLVSGSEVEGIADIQVLGRPRKRTLDRC
jgi:hypothetical protein